jgi:hypothetical protein
MRIATRRARGFALGVLGLALPVLARGQSQPPPT